MTGYASIATAIEAIKVGATHYLAKPSNAEEIIAAFGRTDGQTEVSVAAAPAPVARVEWEHIQKLLAERQGNIADTAARSACIGARCSASSPSGRRRLERIIPDSGQRSAARQLVSVEVVVHRLQPLDAELVPRKRALERVVETHTHVPEAAAVVGRFVERR